MALTNTLPIVPPVTHANQLHHRSLVNIFEANKDEKHYGVLLMEVILAYRPLVISFQVSQKAHKIVVPTWHITQCSRKKFRLNY